MSPIPSRIYNAAVGGHVAGADQIIDDETGLTLDKVTGGALEEKTYTSGSDNGMGRVVLRKNLVNGVNTLVQTMINKSNTIYVIQYDFTLGEDITIPANCVLEFDGGSINSASNLAITCNKTLMQGNITLNGIILEGTICNNRIESNWFGLVSGESNTIDNGSKITKMIVSCENTLKDLHISSGTYRTTLPVHFNADYSVYMDGEILYAGTAAASAILVGGNSTTRSHKHFYLSVKQESFPAFTEDADHYIVDPTRNIGIEAQAVYCCDFHINLIKNFIYGLVVSDINSIGCGDNKFYINFIWDAYKGITIMSGVSGGNMCWVNDNQFYGARIWRYENQQLKRTAVCFVKGNTNSMADNAIFIGLDWDHYYNGIDFGNMGKGCIFLCCRFEDNVNPVINEGNNGNFILSGQKNYLTVPKGKKTVFDYACDLWKRDINKTVLNIPQLYYAYDNVSKKISYYNLRSTGRFNVSEESEVTVDGLNTDGNPILNNRRVFFDMDVTLARKIRIEGNCNVRPQVFLYDNEGNILPEIQNYRNYIEPYDDGADAWWSTDFPGLLIFSFILTKENLFEICVKDTNIAKIRFIFGGDSTSYILSLKVTADKEAIIDNINKSFHLSALPTKVVGVSMVPSTVDIDLPVGTSYVDNGVMKFWNGTAWVDATGTAV